MCDHDHDNCIENALSDAEKICKERKVRFTKIRRRVLELIWSGHRAVKAYDILKLLSNEGKAPQPPMVYRALDFLVEQGFVHKVESLNAFVGCVHPGCSHNCQLLICEKCGIVEEFCQNDIRKMIEKGAKKKGFKVGNFVLEVMALCPSCQS